MPLSLFLDIFEVAFRFGSLRLHYNPFLFIVKNFRRVCPLLNQPMVMVAKTYLRYQMTTSYFIAHSLFMYRIEYIITSSYCDWSCSLLLKTAVHFLETWCKYCSYTLLLLVNAILQRCYATLWKT